MVLRKQAIDAEGIHSPRADKINGSPLDASIQWVGGKPDSAMGGGSDVLKLDDALAVVDDFVSGKLAD